MSIDEILIEIDTGKSAHESKVQLVNSQALKANLNQLIGLVKQLGQDSTGSLELDEVSVSIKITPDGRVALLGTGQGTGAMTLRFKRPSIAKLPLEVEVNSGLNYSQLEKLLVANKWQDANQETWDLLCQAIHKHKGSYLSIVDINLIPCQALNTIDQLWQTHSQGRFGFSVQKSIFEANK